MTLLPHLTALARGERPADDRLLGNCRMEWGGGEAYGEEAILESFRASPFAPGAHATLVETPMAAAWIGETSALIADLYDGRIGRLWRLGEGAAPEPEPAVAVAFDPDLQQARGELLWRAEDHPELARDMAAEVATAAAALARDTRTPMHRARVFVLRAFSAGATSAVLFAVHRLTGGAVRTSGFGHAVALIETGGHRLVIDPPRATRWTPRL